MPNAIYASHPILLPSALLKTGCGAVGDDVRNPSDLTTVTCTDCLSWSTIDAVANVILGLSNGFTAAIVVQSRLSAERVLSQRKSRSNAEGIRSHVCHESKTKRSRPLRMARRGIRTELLLFFTRSSDSDSHTAGASRSKGVQSPSPDRAPCAAGGR